jgi:hypothetical protein
MGCGSTKEKIENEIIAMKLERVGVQMERRNQIKLLEDIDGRKIEEPNIPDYLAIKPKGHNIGKKENLISKKGKYISSKILTDKRGRSKSTDMRKKIKNLKTNSTTALSKHRAIKKKFSKKASY